jgi:hypothetical protein
VVREHLRARRRSRTERMAREKKVSVVVVALTVACNDLSNSSSTFCDIEGQFTLGFSREPL